MEYLKQYVSSLKYLEEFSEEYRKKGNNFEAVEKELLENCSTENENRNSRIRARIEEITNSYVKTVPPENLINNCHVITYDFYQQFIKGYGAKHIDITIGNSYYQGKSRYNLSKQKLKTIINQGFQPDKELPVHVWLTLDDMTVFDLTIIPTLIAKGELNLNEVTNHVLVWRENTISDFHFEPLLVDNDFIGRVEKIKNV